MMTWSSMDPLLEPRLQEVRFGLFLGVGFSYFAVIFGDILGHFQGNLLFIYLLYVLGIRAWMTDQLINNIITRSIFMYHFQLFSLSPLMVGFVFLLAAACYMFTTPVWGRIIDKRLCTNIVENFHQLNLVYLLSKDV